MKANSHFLLKIIFKNIFTYLYAAVGVLRHSCGGQEDILQESGLSFGHVGSGDQTQVIRIGSKRLHPLSQLASSQGGDSRALTALETPRDHFWTFRYGRRGTIICTWNQFELMLLQLLRENCQ